MDFKAKPRVGLFFQYPLRYIDSFFTAWPKPCQPAIFPSILPIFATALV